MHFEASHDSLVETSADSNSNISSDICPNLSSGDNSNFASSERRTRPTEGTTTARKQSLSGYIIYASEVRKQVINRNPNQNFGDISRLVGNEWKSLPPETKAQYDQKALSYNSKTSDRHASTNSLPTSGPFNGVTAAFDDDAAGRNLSSTPKKTRRRLAKTNKNLHRQRSDMASSAAATNVPPQCHCTDQSNAIEEGKSRVNRDCNLTDGSKICKSTPRKCLLDAACQTSKIRFVEPPKKKRKLYEDTFNHFLINMDINPFDNKLDAVEPNCNQISRLADSWLGAGLGRHATPEAALLALREFMLKDSFNMSYELQPYLKFRSDAATC